ncbi:hypothetical protein T459_04510 [Capsicum annuum]|uniref:beta-ketoacyl-[acyl-carrier-protein] synthase I n=1 Tax=Capsicum annuum TaxID=4072 RepID=A0A2G3A578_CAPAN|nr:hypothetical protein T459_04510 [Capsicum annuum]
MRIILLRVAAGFAHRINANPSAVKVVVSRESVVVYHPEKSLNLVGDFQFSNLGEVLGVLIGGIGCCKALDEVPLDFVNIFEGLGRVLDVLHHMDGDVKYPGFWLLEIFPGILVCGPNMTQGGLIKVVQGGHNHIKGVRGGSGEQGCVAKAYWSEVLYHGGILTFRDETKKFIPSLEDFVKIPFYEPVIIEVLGYLHKVIPKDGSSFKGGASINSRNQPEFGRVAYLDCHMDTLKGYRDIVNLQQVLLPHNHHPTKKSFRRGLNLIIIPQGLSKSMVLSQFSLRSPQRVGLGGLFASRGVVQSSLEQDSSSPFLLELAQISYRVSIPTDFFYILYKIGSGVVLCMEKVLVQSRVKSEDVNYINAHVASTPAGDLNKYQAILHCFGENPEVTTLFFEKSTHTTCSQQPLSNTLKMISRELFGQATQATA